MPTTLPPSAVAEKVEQPVRALGQEESSKTQPVRSGAASAAPPLPSLLDVHPDKYVEGGKVPIEIHLHDVELYMRRHRFQTEQYVELALQFFDSLARYKLSGAGVDQIVEWTAFKESVRTLFGRQKDVMTYQLELASTSQRPDEHVDRFAARVLDLVMKAHPDWEHAYRQDQARSTFINGIADPEVKRELQMRGTDATGRPLEWSRIVGLANSIEYNVRSCHEYSAGCFRAAAAEPVEAAERLGQSPKWQSWPLRA